MAPERQNTGLKSGQPEVGPGFRSLPFRTGTCEARQKSCCGITPIQSTIVAATKRRGPGRPWQQQPRPVTFMPRPRQTTPDVLGSRLTSPLPRIMPQTGNTTTSQRMQGPVLNMKIKPGHALIGNKVLLVTQRALPPAHQAENGKPNPSTTWRSLIVSMATIRQPGSDRRLRSAYPKTTTR